MTVRRTSGLLTAVAKMAEQDEETAALFVQLSLFNTMADLIEQAGPVLEADTDAIIAKGAAVAREHLLANTAGMSEEEIVEAALAVKVLDAYVAKNSLIGSALDLFNRLHQRDSEGRFIRMDVNRQTVANEPRSVQQKEGHAQARNWATRLQAAGLAEANTPLRLHYQRMDDQGKIVSVGDQAKIKTSTTVGELKNALKTNRDADNTLMLQAASFDRRSIPELGGQGAAGQKRRAALDAMMTFAGPEHFEGAARVARSIPVGKPRDEAASTAFNRPGTWDDRKIYRRMSLAGEALARTTATGSNANVVGNLSRLIGDLGPEAEKVLSPGLRRTAYRYRGTEKRPDRGLMRQNDEAGAAAKVIIEAGEGATPDEQKFTTRRAQNLATTLNNRGYPKTTPASGSAAHWYLEEKELDEELSADQKWLLVHGDTAALGLVAEHRLPDLRSAEISMQSGELPPSVGVIIDADGDLVSQSQGYNGDHYLPFDLKNLKSLQGGQYVRTRASGGLTTEDIYTGLLAGARQVQVVSNSGVFTLEFDPDVRGGRRYTDKAVRMINRYGRILETIESGRIMQRDISPKEKADLYQQAVQYAETKDSASIRQLHTQLIDRKRQEQERPDDEEFLEAAAHQVDAEGQDLSPGQRKRQIDDAARAMMAEHQSKQVRRLVLDGSGYTAAMTALHQEFPFFIRRVSYETLPDFLSNRGQRPQGAPGGRRDTGYVEPGQTNPKGARGAPRYGESAQPAGAPRATPESEGDAKVIAQRQGQPEAVTRALAAISGQTQSVPLNQAIKAGTPLARTVEARVNRLLTPLELWRLDDRVDPSGMTVDDATAMQLGGPVRFLHHRLFDVAKESPKAFVDWLLTDATEPDRHNISRGLDKLEDWVQSQDEDYRDAQVLRGQDYAEWDSLVQDIKNVVQAAQPFAETSGGNWKTARPESGVPRPQAVPEIVALGTDPKAYDEWLARQDDDQQAAVDNAEQQRTKPRDMADSINRKIDELEAATDPIDQARAKLVLHNQQKAWAFVVARHLATNLAHLIEEGAAAPASGAGPKVVKQYRPDLAVVLDRLDLLSPQ